MMICRWRRRSHPRWLTWTRFHLYFLVLQYGTGTTSRPDRDAHPPQGLLLFAFQTWPLHRIHVVPNALHDAHNYDAFRTGLVPSFGAGSMERTATLFFFFFFFFQCSQSLAKHHGNPSTKFTR